MASSDSPDLHFASPSASSSSHRGTGSSAPRLEKAQGLLEVSRRILVRVLGALPLSRPPGVVRCLLRLATGGGLDEVVGQLAEV